MAAREDNIIAAPPIERTIYSSMGELMLILLKVHNDAVLQIDLITGEKLTANVLLNRAIHLAKWFRNNNIAPGDCISTSSENCLDYCIMPIAAFFTGVIFAPLNPENTPGEAKHVINLSKPKLIFCSQKTFNKLISNKADYPSVENFVLLGKKHSTHKNVIMYEDIIKNAKEDNIDEDFETTYVDPDETVALILSSSGTTGLPKGVMITHYNLTSYIEIARVVMERNVGATIEHQTKPEVITGITPFFHSMGFMIMTLTIMGGKTLLVYPKFEPKPFLASIAKFQVTTLVVPPPIILFLVKHPMVKNYDLSSLREIKSGAAPLGKELQSNVINMFKTKYVSQNYGMTETTLGVLLSWERNDKPGSVGTIVPGMKCKVIDKDGNALGPNKEGELCFQGPLIMKGYINNPKATAETIDKDNWLHTGDVGYYDDERYFYIVDRIKELIKCKGFQVAPAELEALLMTHPAVADAAVIGVPDDRVGEKPAAYVVKKPTHKNLTAKAIQEYVAERVSPAKQLHGGVTFISQIPRNPTGKILRRILRENAKKTPSKL